MIERTSVTDKFSRVSSFVPLVTLCGRPLLAVGIALASHETAQRSQKGLEAEGLVDWKQPLIDWVLVSPNLSHATLLCLL